MNRRIASLILAIVCLLLALACAVTLVHAEEPAPTPYVWGGPCCAPTPTPVAWNGPCCAPTPTPTPALIKIERVVTAAPPQTLPVTGAAVGDTYYVAPSGSDAWPGSLEHPFRTINKGAAALAPGDTLYVRGGIYREVVGINTSGVNVLAYPDETPIVDGGYTLPAADWAPLFAVNGDNVNVSGFEVTRSNWLGLVLVGQHVTAGRINSHNNRENGILVRGDYGIVENSEVWENADSNSPGGPTRQYWAGGLSAARDTADGITVNAILRRNVVHDNYGEGLSTFEANGTIIEDNVVYDNMTNVYISDAQTIMVRRNLVYCTPGYAFPGAHVGIMLGDETRNPPSQAITVANNLVVGCNRNFYWWSGASGDSMANVLVAHNTFVNAAPGSEANLLIAPGAHRNVRVVNNIVVQGDAVPLASVPSGLTFSHNLWGKAPPGAAAGPGDVVGDPLLAQSGVLAAGWFTPATTSRAVDAGLALAEVPDDYRGEARDAKPDMGAIEAPNVCPAGTVKYEDGSGYEYGADKGTITINGAAVTWAALSPMAVISSVCIKAGQDLYWPDPASGTFTVPNGKDVSHAVLTLTGPNAVTVSRFTASSGSGCYGLTNAAGSVIGVKPVGWRYLVTVQLANKRKFQFLTFRAFRVGQPVRVTGFICDGVFAAMSPWHGVR